MCRVRAGDVAAFSQLFTRHRPRVERFLFRLGRDHGKAEDGAQEVFLKLWQARHRYTPRARFTTFLYQIAQNHWWDELRKTRARPVEVAWDGSEEIGADHARERPGTGGGALQHLRAPAATEPHYHLFLRYQQWRIQEAIGRLPEAYRLVFVLAHLEDCKLVEIATILAIPVGTVKSRMHAAVRLLREALRAEDMEAER